MRNHLERELSDAFDVSQSECYSSASVERHHYREKRSKDMLDVQVVDHLLQRCATYREMFDLLGVFHIFLIASSPEEALLVLNN